MASNPSSSQRSRLWLGLGSAVLALLLGVVVWPLLFSDDGDVLTTDVDLEGDAPTREAPPETAMQSDAGPTLEAGSAPAAPVPAQPDEPEAEPVKPEAPEFPYIEPVCDPGFVVKKYALAGRVVASDQLNLAGVKVRFVAVAGGRGLEASADAAGNFKLEGEVIVPKALRDFVFIEAQRSDGQLGYVFLPWIDLGAQSPKIRVYLTRSRAMHTLDVVGVGASTAQLLYPFRGFHYLGAVLDLRGGRVSFPHPRWGAKLLVSGKGVRTRLADLSTGSVTEVEVEGVASVPVLVVDAETGKPVPNAQLMGRGGEVTRRPYDPLPFGFYVGRTDAGGRTTMPGQPAGDFWVRARGYSRNPDTTYDITRITTVEGQVESLRVALRRPRKVVWSVPPGTVSELETENAIPVQSCSGGLCDDAPVPPHLYVQNGRVVMHDAPERTSKASTSYLGARTFVVPTQGESNVPKVRRMRFSTLDTGRPGGAGVAPFLHEPASHEFAPALSMGTPLEPSLVLPRLPRGQWRSWPIHTCFGEGQSLPLRAAGRMPDERTPLIRDYTRRWFHLDIPRTVLTQFPPLWHVRIAGNPAPYLSRGEAPPRIAVRMGGWVMCAPDRTKPITVTVHAGLPFEARSANPSTDVTVLARGLFHPAEKLAEGEQPTVTLTHVK